jgi:hypothetical protein
MRLTEKKLIDLMKEYTDTLDSTGRDEWYGTEADIWQEFYNDFLLWLEKK